MRRNNRSGCPRNDFREGGGYLGIPPFEHHSPINALEHFRRDENDVDADLPVGAKNASTRELEKSKQRSFPQRPHRSSFLQEEDNRTRNERQKTPYPNCQR